MKRFFKAIIILWIVALAAGCAAQPAGEPLSQAALEQRAREFVSQLEAGKFKDARQNFDSAMRLSLSENKLSETWQSLQQQAGVFERQGDARIVEEQGYQSVYVTCRFGLGAVDVKVVFDSKGRIAGLFFQPAEDPTALAPEYAAPDYADTNAFHEEEVTVGASGWELPGTFTIPNGSGPFPAVVLVHGSGPNDRDETIGPNRVFKDLAWGLASNGVAVLRYEKRTREHADRFTSDLLTSLTVQEEVIDDALAAVDWLTNRGEVNGQQIFVVGHSLGAMIAPRIAAQSSQLAGIVLLAPAARQLQDIMLEQSVYLANSDGVLDSNESRDLNTLQDQVEKVSALPGNEDIKPDELILGAAPAYWLDLMANDPVMTAKSLTLPMLILQGERDYQVTMTDYALWQQGLAGQENAVLKSYPSLNHLLIAGSGTSLPAEYQIAGHVDSVIIEEIISFIQSR